jgi:hypothetical protein
MKRLRVLADRLPRSGRRTALGEAYQTQADAEADEGGLGMEAVGRAAVLRAVAPAAAAQQPTNKSGIYVNNSLLEIRI